MENHLFNVDKEMFQAKQWDDGKDNDRDNDR